MIEKLFIYGLNDYAAGLFYVSKKYNIIKRCNFLG